MESLNHVVLIGFMGCGKSTVGKALAKAINLPLFDTDTVIEQLREQRIADFFTIEGETKFREYEHEIITELLNSIEPSIIMCGGGTPCFRNTMELLNRHATTIYLHAPVELLYQRLHRTVARRPMLQNQPDLQKYITGLLTQREPTYQQAQHSIDVNRKTVDEIVFEITYLLNNPNRI